MATKIQLRRDTSTNWTANNPVLSSGEVAFSTDLGKIKIGNGTANWIDLPYIHLTPAELSSSYQPLDSDLTAIAALSASATGYAKKTGGGTWTVDSDYVASLSGTANEVEVSASTGSITLSLPSTINANTTGNAATATALQTARTISLGGDLSGSASFDGTSNITITASVDSQSSVNSITGTENEITVSASVGDITLSLPNTINANTTGTAASLTTARTIALLGDVSGSANFDGSASVSINAQIQPNSVELGTDTIGNYVATASAGSGISISGSGSENAAITISNTGVTSLTGTANQISVSASNGDSTISFPSAVTFPGTVTLNANPSQALQAATKQYVDEIAEGLKAKPAVEIATTENLSATYDNGTSGVGATLTASANGAFPEIDGITLTSTTPGLNGVLVKNQTNAAQNGRYNLTQVGDSENPWILTRCGLCDQSDEIAGTYYFVKQGTIGAGTGWVAVVDDPSTFVIGTDDIDLFQFSGAGTYTAGTGLSLNGTQFNNTGVLSLQGTTNEVEVSASSGAVTVSLPSTINANTTGSAATLTTSRTIELTGDVTGSASFNGGANASISATLANSGVSASTYGAATSVPVITVDAKGRVTNVTTEAIESLPSQTGNAGKYLTTNGTVASWGTIDLSSYAALSGATFTGVVTGVSASAAGSTSFRKTTMSTSAPTGGSDGDIWLQYS